MLLYKRFNSGHTEMPWTLELTYSPGQPPVLVTPTQYETEAEVQTIAEGIRDSFAMEISGDSPDPPGGGE